VSASDFTTDFESFLQSVDTDSSTPGAQPYLDPSGDPILTLADTHWFGPAQTWPRELANYPYIDFWHRLDAALLAESLPDMGPETIGDALWDTLFSSGPLRENRGITMTVARLARISAELEASDQLGMPRPANALGDVGAIEVP